VLVLVVLPSLAAAGPSASGLAVSIGIMAVKVIGLVAVTVGVGNRAIPRILDHVAATRSRELFTLTVLVLALGIAVGSALLFGVSMALGAFLAGMVVGRSEFSLRAASEALPMRDAFAVLFFVSIGMLLDPHHLIDAPVLIAAALAVVVIGKPLAAFLVVRLLGYPLRIGLAVGAALAQIGEFSFILAILGRDLGILTTSAVNTIVAVSMISITVNPLIYRTVKPLERWISRHPRLWRALNPAVAESPTHETREISGVSPRAVVVGYGPTGRIATRLLRENGIEPTVIELNLETVRRLRAEGVSAVYGDAGHRETLEGAGVVGADSLVLTSAGMAGVQDVIRLAREINPDVQVLVRTAYLRDLDALRKSGADSIFSGEAEVALALTEDILRRLGATPEQVDRERGRAHAELFGEAGRDGRPGTPVPGPALPRA